MLRKNGMLILFVGLASLIVSSCANPFASASGSSLLSSSDSSSSLPSSSSASQSVSSPETDGDYYKASYGHRFLKNDLSAAGGQTSPINGLKWTYSAATWYGYYASRGVQIGSEANPQTSPWTISASLPEGVKVKSYSIQLAVASGGSSRYQLAFGTYSKSGTFDSTTPEIFADVGLDEETSFFALSLNSIQKAMYLYSISFDVYVPLDVSLDIYSDIEETAEPVIPGEGDIPATEYTDVTSEEYYKNIDFSLKGDSLVDELRPLVSDMTGWSYGDARYILQYTDEMTDRPGFDYGMWDGDNIKATWDEGSSWSREHVWACDQMQLNPSHPRPDNSTIGYTSDLHNLRVACPASNAYHSNKFFDTENTDSAFYPNITGGLSGYHAYTGDFRGDTARILFYMYVRYDGLVLNDAMDPTDNVSMGKLSLLIQWNDEDPVDAFEQQRNNRIYEYQGNRNPFIDHPELGDVLFE